VTVSSPPGAADDHIADLLETYRKIPHQLPGKGQRPIPQFDGEMVGAGGRSVYLRSTHDVSAAAEREAVFVHGLGGSARNWTDLMYLLGPVARGFAPDLPGFGQSPMPDDRDYSLEAHARTVIRLIEDQCRGPVDLFGNSMGGAISVRIAALRPDLVRTLVLVSPALPDLRPRLSVAPLLAMATPGFRTVAAKMMGIDQPGRAVDRMLNLCYYDPTIVHSDRREELVNEAAWRLSRQNHAEPLRLSAKGLAEGFVPGRDSYLWSLASKVDCQTLAVFGTHDKLVDSRLANRTAQTIVDSRVVTLPRTGHVAQLEQPKKMAQMVLSMWAEQK